jgi:hypothetical protein
VPALALAEAAAQVPLALRPRPPAWLEDRAERVLAVLHVSRGESLDRVLAKLVEHFRSFRDADLVDPEGQDMYTDLALGGVGACRHRAYALMPTLHALGIPARYVGNEAHAWIEVFITRVGWTRIDLGGWDVPLNANAPSERATFQPANPDPFPRPAQYSAQYSAQPQSTVGGGASGGAGANGGGDEHGDPGGASPEDSSASGGTGGASASRAGTTRAGTTRAGAAGESGQGGASGIGAGAGGGDEEDEPVLHTSVTIAGVYADSSGGFEGRQGFVRGSMLRVEGDVRDERAAGVGGLALDVELMRGLRVVATLGTTVSRPDGRWEVRVVLPAWIDPGEYSVRASTPGDARHAAAVGE